MKIVCSQSDLKNNLSLANRAVPSRPEPLVLGNVLIVAEETNQKVSITAFEVIEGGSITLPAKLLNEIVARLPEVEITLDSTETDDLIATLSSASGTFQLTGIDAEEFPQLPTVEAGETVTLPAKVFSEGLSGCLFAASTELSKQVLTGVHVKTQDNGETNTREILEFAATDSHRLAVVETSLITEEEENETGEMATPVVTDFAATIPAKALRELERMLNDAKDKETVQIKFDDSQMIFRVSDRILTSLRIAGDYPAYNRLIPQSFTRSAIVERKRLLSSLELV